MRTAIVKQGQVVGVDGVRVALSIHGADRDCVLFGVNTVIATCSPCCAYPSH
jgi:hypothetical protein